MQLKDIPHGKTRITIRIDDDILEWFRSQAEAAEGGNYQTILNHALREYINDHDRPIEDVIRRVIREELATSRTSPVTFKSNTNVAR